MPRRRSSSAIPLPWTGLAGPFSLPKWSSGLPGMGDAGRLAWNAFDPSRSLGPLLDLQRQMFELWLQSSQTIALRFWLAPPWLAASSWVRGEWGRMTLEKAHAAGESAMTAARMSLDPGAWQQKRLPRTAGAILQPYHRRTGGNARRLGQRALQGPLPLLAEAVEAAGRRSAAGKGRRSRR